MGIYFLGFCLQNSKHGTCSDPLPSVNYISTIRTIQICVWLLKFVGHRTYLKTQPANFERKTSLSGEPLLNHVLLLFPNKTEKETKRNEQNGAMIYLLSRLSVCSWFSVFPRKSLMLWKKVAEIICFLNISNTSTLNSLWLGRLECSLFSQWKQNKQISQEIKRNHIKIKRGSVTYSIQNDTSKKWTTTLQPLILYPFWNRSMLILQPDWLSTAGEPVLFTNHTCLFFTLDRIVHVLNRIMRYK